MRLGKGGESPTATITSSNQDDNNDGTDANNPTLGTAGRIGNAMDFSGAKDVESSPKEDDNENEVHKDEGEDVEE